jgi:putative transcriptional regulator
MALDPRQIAQQDNYQSLLLAYAAGILDDAQRLIVGAHLMLMPQARSLVHMCEALGGALISKQCEPVSMKRGSLENVLARLGEDTPPPQKSAPPEMEIPEEIGFIAPLLGHTSCRVRKGHWHQAQAGIEKFDLPLHCRSHAQCLKAERGVRMPHGRRSDVEITLVIEGSMSDECGHYKRGDMVVIDRSATYGQTSCPRTGGIYMVVSSAGHSGSLSSWLARLLSP